MMRLEFRTPFRMLMAADTGGESVDPFSDFSPSDFGYTDYDTWDDYNASVDAHGREQDSDDYDSSDPYDWSNWAEVQVDENGNLQWNEQDSVSKKTGEVVHGFGEASIADTSSGVAVTGYRDPETGQWVNLEQKAGAQKGFNERQRAQAASLFDTGLDANTIKALDQMNDMDRGTILSNVIAGSESDLAQLIAATGHVPDNLENFSEDQIDRATSFAQHVQSGMLEGKSAQQAWKDASKTMGDPYGTNHRNIMMWESIAGAVMLPLAAAMPAAGVTGGISYNAYNLMPAAVAAIPSMPFLYDLGMSGDKKSSGKAEPSTPSSPANEEAKMAASTPVKTEAPVESKPKEEVTPVEKGDVYNNEMTNFLGLGGTGGITMPELPSLEGTGFNPTAPEVKTTATDQGFNDESSDDSGSDTLETTTPPSSGVGTDTYSNPNVEEGRKGWGLGEEDPNRANYDNDKWNRGMERVSTNVVSDAKVKDFITKTFSKDPVLIKTVKIMKSRP